LPWCSTVCFVLTFICVEFGWRFLPSEHDYKQVNTFWTKWQTTYSFRTFSRRWLQHETLINLSRSHLKYVDRHLDNILYRHRQMLYLNNCDNTTSSLHLRIPCQPPSLPQ
jgi:hypothetical protein